MTLFDDDSRETVDFTAYRHPVLAVACPTCGAKRGVWCRRPSGHKASHLHRARGALADDAWERQGRPAIHQEPPEQQPPPAGGLFDLDARNQLDLVDAIDQSRRR